MAGCLVKHRDNFTFNYTFLGLRLDLQSLIPFSDVGIFLFLTISRLALVPPFWWILGGFTFRVKASGA
jgi:hypothetical protein